MRRKRKRRDKVHSRKKEKEKRHESRKEESVRKKAVSGDGTYTYKKGANNSKFAPLSNNIMSL
jgi:hypothetical protein